MEIKTKDFKAGSRRAVKNVKVQQAARRATGNLLRERNNAAADLPEWEELRDRAREIKAHTIARLDEYLAQFADSVEKAGGKVVWASTAQEASDYVVSLAREKGVRTVVKGKSMATEEIDLNHRLADVGVEAIETDLGEYMIQLAGETPFHIIAPAIHKTRQDFGQLFSEHLSIPYEEDPQRLTQIARHALRKKFVQADMGVTGANFGVAETGTIVLVENEGNQRLSTALPPVHISVMGMEKVIPTLQDLSVFLALLPRSATGQKASSYVSMITGPRHPGEIDGPEEFHMVILDNGRSRILADETMRESLYCIRCAACLNICPVYNSVGGHAYGWVYSGPIGSIITPELVGVGEARDLPAASTLCAACRDVCPIKIDIPHMLLKLRHKSTEPTSDTKATASPNPSKLEKWIVRAWAASMKSQKAYSATTAFARLAQRPLLKNGHFRWLPPVLKGWTDHREFPALAPRPFRQIWDERLSKDASD